MGNYEFCASYDYSELIERLNAEIKSGVIDKGSDIQILRDFQPKFGDYYPIIDYFYSPDKMAEIESKGLKKDQKLLDGYEMFRNLLELNSVNEVLAEMEDWNSLTHTYKGGKC